MHCNQLMWLASTSTCSSVTGTLQQSLSLAKSHTVSAVSSRMHDNVIDIRQGPLRPAGHQPHSATLHTTSTLPNTMRAQTYMSVASLACSEQAAPAANALLDWTLPSAASPVPSTANLLLHLTQLLCRPNPSFRPSVVKLSRPLLALAASRHLLKPPQRFKLC
jgi:hypothetical protein